MTRCYRQDLWQPGRRTQPTRDSIKSYTDKQHTTGNNLAF